MGIEWGYPKTWSTLHEDLNRWQGINQQSWEYLNPNGHRPQLHLSKNHCRWRWRLASHSVHLLDVHAPPNCCDIFTVKISIYIYIHIYIHIYIIYIYILYRLALKVSLFFLHVFWWWASHIFGVVLEALFLGAALNFGLLPSLNPIACCWAFLSAGGTWNRKRYTVVSMIGGTPK